VKQIKIKMNNKMAAAYWKFETKPERGGRIRHPSLPPLAAGDATICPSVVDGAGVVERDGAAAVDAR